MRPDIEGPGRDNPAQASGAGRPAADPAHPKAARAATKTATKTPPKKEYHIATWIALIAAVAAIISAFIANKQVNAANQQVNAANQQNIVAEQQQLVALITTMTQQLDQGQPSTSTAQLAMSDTVTLEAESAEVIITELHGDGVTDFEYDTVARALYYWAGDTSQAIVYYQDAVGAPPHNVGTQADALRGEAVLYYALVQSDKGHEYFMQAVEVYSGHPEMLQSVRGNNIAESYLDDAQDQLGISGGCGIASTDINEAKNFLSQAGGPNKTNAKLLNNDQTTYSKECPSPTGSTGSFPDEGPYPAGSE